MNKILILFLGLIAISLAQDSAYIDGGPALVGDVLFYKSFNDGSLEGWSGTGLSKASIVSNGLNGKKALKIEATTRGTFLIAKQITNANFAKFTTVRLSATIKAEGVSVPADTFNGVKVMLVTVTYDGVKNYPQKTRVWGTFGWNTTIVDKDIVITGDIQTINVQIGLQDSTGTLYIDNVKLTVISAPPPLPVSAIWDLETSCETYGPGIVKPIVYCHTTNVPSGFTVPNTFQIRIGDGPATVDVTDSFCHVSYFSGNVDVFCDALTPTATGDITYPIYARTSLTQDWILTKSTATTHWAYLFLFFL